MYWHCEQTLGLTRSEHAEEGHPYLRLLRLYLEEFLPRTRQSRPADALAGVTHASSLLLPTHLVGEFHALSQSQVLKSQWLAALCHVVALLLLAVP